MLTALERGLSHGQKGDGQQHDSAKHHLTTYPQNLWITLCVVLWKCAIYSGSVRSDRKCTGT